MKFSISHPLSRILLILSISLLFLQVEPKIGLVGHHFSSNFEGSTLLVTGGLYRKDETLYYSSGTFLRDYRGSNWEKQPDGSSPGPRTNSHSVFFTYPSLDNDSEKDNEYFYVFGGENWNGVLSDQYLYHLNTKTWKRLPSSPSTSLSSSTPSKHQSFPLKRAGHSLSWDNQSKKIFMFGGRYVSNSRLSFYDPSNLDPNVSSPVFPEWTKDRTYEGFSDLWEFTPLSNKWVKLSSGTNSLSGPLPREQATLFSLDSIVFLYGGIDPRSGFRYNDFWTFNRNQWVRLGPVVDKSTKFNPFYPPPLSHSLFIPSYHKFILNNVEKKVLVGGILYGGLTGGLNEHLLCGQAYKFSFPTISSYFSDPSNLSSQDLSIDYFSFFSSNNNKNEELINWTPYKLNHIKSYSLESYIFIESSSQIIEFGGLSLKKLDNVFDVAPHLDTQFEDFLPLSLSLPPLDYFKSTHLCSNFGDSMCNYPLSLTSIYSTPLSTSVWGVQSDHELFSSVRRIKVTPSEGFLLRDDTI